MNQPLTVSDAARELSDRLTPAVRPRDISGLFYQRELRDDICPIVGGRRLIPADYLPQVEAALRRHGYAPRRQNAASNGVTTNDK